jgi:hypothetical protein
VLTALGGAVGEIPTELGTELGEVPSELGTEVGKVPAVLDETGREVRLAGLRTVRTQ